MVKMSLKFTAVVAACGVVATTGMNIFAKDYWAVTCKPTEANQSRRPSVLSIQNPSSLYQFIFSNCGDVIITRPVRHDRMKKLIEDLEERVGVSSPEFPFEKKKGEARERAYEKWWEGNLNPGPNQCTWRLDPRQYKKMLDEIESTENEEKVVNPNASDGLEISSIEGATSLEEIKKITKTKEFKQAQKQQMKSKKEQEKREKEIDSKKLEDVNGRIMKKWLDTASQAKSLINNMKTGDVFRVSKTGKKKVLPPLHIFHVTSASTANGMRSISIKQTEKNQKTKYGSIRWDKTNNYSDVVLKIDGVNWKLDLQSDELKWVQKDNEKEWIKWKQETEIGKTIFVTNGKYKYNCGKVVDIEYTYNPLKKVEEFFNPDRALYHIKFSIGQYEQTKQDDKFNPVYDGNGNSINEQPFWQGDLKMLRSDFKFADKPVPFNEPLHGVGVLGEKDHLILDGHPAAILQIMVSPEGQCDAINNKYVKVYPELDHIIPDTEQRVHEKLIKIQTSDSLLKHVNPAQVIPEPAHVKKSGQYVFIPIYNPNDQINISLWKKKDKLKQVAHKIESSVLPGDRDTYKRVQGFQMPSVNLNQMAHNQVLSHLVRVQQTVQPLRLKKFGFSEYKMENTDEGDNGLRIDMKLAVVDEGLWQSASRLSREHVDPDWVLNPLDINELTTDIGRLSQWISYFIEKVNFVRSCYVRKFQKMWKDPVTQVKNPWRSWITFFLIQYFLLFESSKQYAFISVGYAILAGRYPHLPSYEPKKLEDAGAQDDDEAKKWGKWTEKWILRIARATDWEEFSQIVHYSIAVSIDFLDDMEAILKGQHKLSVLVAMLCFGLATFFWQLPVVVLSTWMHYFLSFLTFVAYFPIKVDSIQAAITQSVNKFLFKPVAIKTLKCEDTVNDKENVEITHECLNYTSAFINNMSAKQASVHSGDGDAATTTRAPPSRFLRIVWFLCFPRPKQDDKVQDFVFRIFLCTLVLIGLIAETFAVGSWAEVGVGGFLLSVLFVAGQYVHMNSNKKDQ